MVINYVCTHSHGFFHLRFYSYDYNMHVEGLLPDYLCLVTLLSSEQNEQFERFCLQLIQIIKRTSSFKIKMDWQ